ncbi:bifunctional diguanylate cyclase/phosphodiesterase [Marinobacterium jannaschii]|uniref:bifunctional diguanylate cyclase/phosphodiesterase n=1 Tax=Marinobacterium jannaschii TaxID=64970 RepID=UPI000688045D|nr:EAL domain-containing protein [Marinobacterium jannaschii]
MERVSEGNAEQRELPGWLPSLIGSIGSQSGLSLLVAPDRVLAASAGWIGCFGTPATETSPLDCLSGSIGLSSPDWRRLLQHQQLNTGQAQSGPVAQNWSLQLHWIDPPAPDALNPRTGIAIISLQQPDQLLVNDRSMSRLVDRIINLHGQALYDELVTALTQELPIDVAMLGILDGENQDSVRSLALMADGQLQPVLTYALQHTPCAEVLRGIPCVYDSNLQQQFPDDLLLQEMAAESYLGVPLKGRNGESLGLLVLMARQPMRFSSGVLMLLKMIVSRIDVELEHAQAADRLALNELSLLKAEQMARLGGWVLNPVSQTLYCTEAMCRLFQLPDHQRAFHRHMLLDRVHADDRDQLRQVATDAIQTGKPFTREHRICLPDGGERWMRTQAEVVRDRSGATVKLLGISQDITREVESGRQIFNSESRLRELIAASPYGITQIDTDLNLTYANRIAHEFHGYDEGEMVGRPLADFIHPDEQAHYLQQLAALDLKHDRLTYQRRGLRKDGSVMHLDVAISVMHSEEGEHLGYIGFITDITERLQSSTLLRQLSTAVEHSPAGILITDLDGLVQYANPSFCTISGYSLKQITGQALEVLESERSSGVYQQMLATLSAGQNWQNELSCKRQSGSSYWGLVSGAPITGDDGQISHFVVIQEDISLRKEQEELLAYQASYDAVTGLPNRILAMDRLTQGIEASRRDDRHTVVMFIDLDQFKRINDTFGHSTGDELLVNAAKLLRDAVREVDTVARFGGDEFLVIMDRVPNQEAVEKVSEKVLNAFNKPVYLGDHELLITASIGVSVYPQDGIDAETLLSNADAAMYSAKARGRNCFHFFTPMMNQMAEERLRIESHLQRALEFKEMRLNFQPVVCLKSNRVTAAEALLRWDCLKLGPVSPDRFIPLAEDLGFIEELGRWVISRVLEQYAGWRAEGLLPRDFKIAINVSPKQFQRGQLAEFVMAELKRTDIAPERLELEVTEGLLMERWPEVEDQIKRLDDAGISLSIDDFGTGFSSISYLRKYPFKTLKIDRSFVQDVLDDRDDATLVQSIIALARSMGMNTIAEGVETEGQHHFLQQAGCDWMQGYFYSRPLEGDDFAALMRSQAEFLRRAGIPEM